MLLAEKEKNKEINFNNNYNNTSLIETVKDLHILKTYFILILIFLLIVLISFISFAIYNDRNTNLAKGLYVKGVDVSGLSYDDAKVKIENYLNSSMKENITLKHNEYDTTINIEQLEVKFDVESALNAAYQYTRNGNILSNNFTILKLMFSPINIEPKININEDNLNNALEDISSKLPDTVIESSYYIEDNQLIITPGKTGLVVNTNEMKKYIINSIQDLSYSSNTLEIITKTKAPQEIDINKIHKEIYKKPIDAYYRENPRTVSPSENGVDFAISIEEATKLVQEKKEEYVIPLQTLYPNVTTNMIGMEAFPDLISSFSTKYPTSNTNRTTNLRLAANKINGTVIMPGNTFSFNTVVGKRTIEAGYKDAAIYQDGKVVDGLAGGICQISTTLFNAAVYANLEIVERRNHQFVPSYVDAGRDATVVYGSQDFKFKNTRNYPIKIVCSVSGGIAKFEIYGLRESNEYQVEITSNITSRTSNYIYSKTYKTLKQNGQTIKTEIICRDTYKVH